MGETFTVATANLWHYPKDAKNRRLALKRELSHHTLDLVAFQEVWHWMGVRSLFREFLSLTGQRGYFKQTNFLGVMFEGLAFSSRNPIQNFFSIELPFSRVFSRRFLIGGRWTAPGGNPIWVLNTHLSPYEEETDRRRTQIQFIAKWIKTHLKNQDLLLMGDFNESTHQEIFSPLKNIGLASSFPIGNCTYCDSNPYISLNQDRRYDYIWSRLKNYGLESSGYFLKETPVSDHYGVQATFKRKSL